MNNEVTDFNTWCIIRTTDSANLHEIFHHAMSFPLFSHYFGKFRLSLAGKRQLIFTYR